MKTEIANPHQKTLDALKKDKKQVLLQTADTITTLKVYFKDCDGGKYTQSLMEDIKKTIPKWGSAAKKLEGLHINNCQDEAVLLAMAKDLDGLYDTFNEIDTWHGKLCGGSGKAKKKRKA